ncbi:MAG: hypothetical protein AB7V77_03205 [Candidatus Woesearchaeota archaeon]
MNSLKEYIESTLAKGYGREQIVNYLLKNGYSQQTIDDAFKQINLVTKNNDLQNYVYTYLNQGYTPEQLYSFLLSKGYKKQELISVFKNVDNQYYNGQMPLEVIHKHDVSSGAVIKIGVALMLMFFIGTGFFFWVQNLNEGGLGKLLDVTIKDITENVNPSENLQFTVMVTNMGRPGNVDVYFNYILRTEYGQLIKKETDTRAFDTTLSYVKEVRIPGDLSSGTYEMEVLATYDRQTAGHKFYFNVGNVSVVEDEPTPTPAATEVEPTPAPTPAPVVTKPAATEVVIKGESDEQLFSMAIDADDKSSSIGYCEKIKFDYLHRECLNQVALLYNDEGVCQYVEENNRDMCYLGLIVDGKYALCSLVKDDVSVNICNQYESLQLAEAYQNGSLIVESDSEEVDDTNISSSDPCEFMQC